MAWPETEDVRPGIANLLLAVAAILILGPWIILALEEAVKAFAAAGTDIGMDRPRTPEFQWLKAFADALGEARTWLMDRGGVWGMVLAGAVLSFAAYSAGSKRQ